MYLRSCVLLHTVFSYRIILPFSLIALPRKIELIPGEWRKQILFSMVIEKGELVHQRFSKHLRMETARTKKDK